MGSATFVSQQLKAFTFQSQRLGVLHSSHLAIEQCQGEERSEPDGNREFFR